MSVSSFPVPALYDPCLASRRVTFTRRRVGSYTRNWIRWPVVHGGAGRVGWARGGVDGVGWWRRWRGLRRRLDVRCDEEYERRVKVNYDVMP